MKALFRRTFWEIKLALTDSGDAALAVFFFGLVVALFPLGVSPDPALLSAIAPGIVWMAVLLSALLSFDRLFQADADDGMLDLHHMDDLPMWGIVAGKALSHWVTSVVPVLVIMPLVGALYPLPLSTLVGSFALGTPAISFLGTAMAALVLGARRPAVLLALLLLPLFSPVLIFGTLAVYASQSGMSSAPYFYLLASLSVLAVTLGPWVGAAAVRTFQNS